MPGAFTPKHLQSGIEKLFKRGVIVYSRPCLHAKMLIAGQTLVVGSANISKHSRDTLDEAAILTKDPVALFPSYPESQFSTSFREPDALKQLFKSRVRA